MGTYKDLATFKLKELESILGLYKIVEGKRLSDLGIKEFLSLYSKVKEPKDLQSKKDMLLETTSILSTMCYYDKKCLYERTVVLDFRSYTGVDLLVDLILPFNKRENLSNKVLNNLNGIHGYLSVLESSSNKYINTLSYRYLRLFLCLALKKQYFNVSILSSFIINQIYIGDGVDNILKVKLEDMERANSTINRANKDLVSGDGIRERNSLNHTIGSAIKKGKQQVNKVKNSIEEIKNSVSDDSEDSKPEEQETIEVYDKKTTCVDKEPKSNDDVKSKPKDIDNPNNNDEVDDNKETGERDTDFRQQVADEDEDSNNNYEDKNIRKSSLFGG